MIKKYKLEVYFEVDDDCDEFSDPKEIMEGSILYEPDFMGAITSMKLKVRK